MFVSACSLARKPWRACGLPGASGRLTWWLPGFDIKSGWHSRHGDGRLLCHSALSLTPAGDSKAVIFSASIITTQSKQRHPGSKSRRADHCDAPVTVAGAAQAAWRACGASRAGDSADLFLSALRCALCVASFDNLTWAAAPPLKNLEIGL